MLTYSLFCVYICLSVYAFISLSIYKSFPSICPSDWFIHPQSISISIHLFLYSIHLSVFLLHIYQSIKSIHLSMSVTPSIHLFLCIPSIGMPVSILYVSLHSPKLFFPHFQKRTQNKTSSGVLFYKQITNALMHHCSNGPMLKCTNAPVHQCTFF